MLQRNTQNTSNAFQPQYIQYNIDGQQMDAQSLANKLWSSKQVTITTLCNYFKVHVGKVTNLPCTSFSLLDGPENLLSIEKF